MPEKEGIKYIQESEFIRMCCYGLKGKIDFFLGSGASKSSGIPVGQEVVWILKRDLFCSETKSPKENFDLNSEQDKKTIQDYLDSRQKYLPCGDYREYSFYMETVCVDEKCREDFISTLIKNKKPSMGYKHLGAILLSDFTKNVWTTNFDDLVKNGINNIEPNNHFIEYGRENIPDIKSLQKDEYPSVCKLHGDFKYGSTKNTSDELKSLDKQLESCFIQELCRKGLVVVGYSGSDDSIMNSLRAGLDNCDFLSNGIYWTEIANSELPERVKELLREMINKGKSAYVVTISDFDSFFENLYSQLGIKNPAIESVKKEKALSFKYDNYLFLETEYEESSITTIEDLKKIISEDLSNIEFRKFPNICIKSEYENIKPEIIKDIFVGIKFKDDKTEKFYFDLRNYTNSMFVKNFSSDNNYLLFVSGLDEIPDAFILEIQKKLIDILYCNSKIRIIVSGRVAAFIHNFEKKIKAKTYTVKTSNNNLLLLETFLHDDNNSFLKQLSNIPFYNYVLPSATSEKNINFRKFISYLNCENLSYEKNKYDFFCNISYRENDLSKINLFKVEDCLKNIANEMIAVSEEECLSEIKLKQIVNNDDLFDFIIKSSMFCYCSKDKISFVNKFLLYYYFISYLAETPVSEVLKLFFIKTGKINKLFLTSLFMTLKLLEYNSGLCKAVANKLDTNLVALLVNYHSMPLIDRYNAYKAILNEYNADKKTIYYYRFTKTDDILANIDSLADSMHQLLPEKFYSQAVKEHCDIIKNFLRNPSSNDLRSFENAIILLGAGNSNWNYEQQEMLKEISVPLLKFFINHEFAEKIKGLLSENTVLRWCDDYKWSENWNGKDWISFVKELISVENTDFYNFKDEKEYSFKLKLFIHFHNNTFIQKLLVPLAKKILTSTSPTAIASCVPNIIDDNFKTQTVDFNYDTVRFTDVFKKSDVSLSDVLQILQIYPVKYSAIPIEAHDLYREVLEAFERKIPDIKEENIPEFYGALVNYIETDSGTYLYDFNKYIKLLNDDQKEKVFDLLFSDLMKKTDWQNIWMLPNNIIVPLLDMVDKQRAISLFEKLRNVDVVYKKFITALYYSKDEKKPLYETAVNEYSEVFAEQVKMDKEREEKLNAFYKSREDVLKQEIDVITNKDNSLINEIDRIFEYIDNHPGFSENKDIHGKLLDLRISHIESTLKYYTKEYKYKIFSPFAVDFLIHSNEDDLESNHENIIKIINDWFSNKEKFWRYFFWTYIAYHKKEEVDEFINKYPLLTERIKESIQQEVTQFLVGNDIFMYDGGKNRFWVVPFVYYLTRFYDNKLPDWFEQNKILNFVAYPAWQLSTHEYDIHVNFEFKWKDWSSVFEWIEEIAGIDEDNIIKQALLLFPNLKNELSKAQIISVFVKKVKSESVYKQQMLDIIINLTIIEMQKDYNDNNNNSINWILSSFWSRTTEDFVARIYSSIDFEKYDLDDRNSCRIAVLEYFCNIATYEQKAKVIETLKNSMDKPNIKIYLAKLGYKKAILAIIDGFLNGDDWKRIWNSSELFMNSTKSFKLLYKCCKLYSYSLEKNCERRELLTGLAKRGIKQNATKWNFWYIRYCLNKEIKKLKKNSLYYEHIQDFLNEIEQKVFSRKLENDK